MKKRKDLSSTVYSDQDSLIRPRQLCCLRRYRAVMEMVGFPCLVVRGLFKDLTPSSNITRQLCWCCPALEYGQVRNWYVTARYSDLGEKGARSYICACQEYSLWSRDYIFILTTSAPYGEYAWLNSYYDLKSPYLGSDVFIFVAFYGRNSYSLFSVLRVFANG